MYPKIDPRSFLAMSLLLLTGGIRGYFCQNDQLYETCRRAFNCGGISGLRYPFWGGPRRPVSCGYPGFGLDCQDYIPLLNISSLSYRVLRIDESIQRLRIARNDLWGTVCPTFLHQTTLDSTLFNLESFSNEQNITLYYGCTANQVQSLSNQSSYCRVNETCIASQVQNLSIQFSCNVNGTNSSGFYLIQGPGLESGTSCGRSINVRVDQTAAEALSSASKNTTTTTLSLLQSALMSGFTVGWSAPGCENCTRSGGVCGYNQTTTSFACYCADRPYDFTCRSSNSSTLSGGGGGNLLLLVIPALLLLCGIILVSWSCTPQRKDTRGEHSNSRTSLFRKTHGEGKANYYELPTFSFSSLVIATNNFSLTNKLGEGGFGPVYKGELLNGQFVAIKRLSRSSGQGLEEFKNEAELNAKLQHKNLVGILGCCIENGEKILVYEYMPNKSLDSFIFEPTKTTLLDWNQRVQIIEGIAHGMLYLHQYSRLRIVHRDLKASNILLDAEMKPKISDFGMARIFGGNELQANTKRIVGTYGYMSPEYAMEGLFSVKSDVFAFGVLMLEIISGKRNTGFRGSNCLSLLGYAWMLWENNIVLDLVDPTLGSLSPALSSPIVYRYIQIGLLCVQESANDRPVMSDVVAMLSNEQTKLASPKHPAFTVGRVLVNGSPRQEDRAEICSMNGLTFSHMHPR